MGLQLASLAQWLEQAALNRRVRGSNPWRGTHAVGDSIPSQWVWTPAVEQQTEQSGGLVLHGITYAVEALLAEQVPSKHPDAGSSPVNRSTWY